MSELFKIHLSKTAEETDSLLTEYFNKKSILQEISLYSLLNGGKRFRPALVTAFIPVDDNILRKEALKACAAIEMIHAFSLVHDDLPCLDNDDMRRGKPSCHKQFGEAQALLAGDALSLSAFSLISSVKPSDFACKLTSELSEGAFKMVEGQYLETVSESTDENILKKIHKLKTGALITTSLRMGAILSGKNEEKLKEITSYGEYLGLLFQLADDLVDIEKCENCNLASYMGKEKTLKTISEISEEAIKIAKKIDPEKQLLISAVKYVCKTAHY